MAATVDQRPWREVVHIERTTGSRGGKVWFLTLECGHHKAVPIPPFRLHRMSVLREAPKRCRCLSCQKMDSKRPMANPFKHHLRLKRPCTNCPFRKLGAIELAPGRLDGIITGLLQDDHSTFPCHKTVHSARGGEWDDDGNYTPSGQESMCAGAAAYLMKHKRPTVGMRVAFATGAASPTDWDEAKELTID